MQFVRTLFSSTHFVSTRFVSARVVSTLFVGTRFVGTRFVSNLLRHLLFCFLLIGYHTTALADSNRLPDLGGSSKLISPAQERQLGAAWLRSLRKQVDTLKEPLIVQYVKDLTFKLAPHSQLIDRRLKTVIVDSRVLNAFAVPGGIIGTNAGLFLYARTEQEFASVLAHEMAHLSQRHFARRLEESQNQAAINLAGILASLIVAVTAGSDAGVAALAGSQAYTLQNQLNYSRLHEQEADRIGLETLAASGMDARSMPSMFRSMLRTSRFNRQLPEYLRTHPLTESRVADTANRAESFPEGSYVEDMDYYFAKSRIMLRYAENPEGALTRFRSIEAQSTPKDKTASYQYYLSQYGQVLAAIKVNRSQEAKSALQNLLNYDRNRISIVVLHAEWLLATGQTDTATQLLREHLSRNTGNYALSRILAEAEIRSGNYETALSLLNSLLPEYENEPDLWFEIAETTGLANDIATLHQARAEYFYQTGRTGRALNQLNQALKKTENNYQKTQIIQNRIRELQEEQATFNF